MLEAAYQSCAWFTLYQQDFRAGVSRIIEARNVKYGSFVQPGDRLTLSVEMTKQSDTGLTFQVRGTVDRQSALAGRLTLKAPVFPSADDPGNDTCREQLREIFARLYRPT